jgi:hypothetical protein
MREKRPSAPMVLSIIAVVSSLAGTGVASVATISALSKKEKKQTMRIADSEVNKLAPGLSVKSAGSAATAATAATASTATNADQLGGVPAGEYQRRLWAVVRSDGTLARGAGVVSSSGGSANYEVKFNRDITNCAFAATIAHPADGAESFGQIEAHIESVVNARDTVGVFTANSAGTLANRAFHLIVDC